MEKSQTNIDAILDLHKKKSHFREVQDTLSSINEEQKVVVFSYKSIFGSRKRLAAEGQNDLSMNLASNLDVRSVVLDPSGERAYVLESRTIEKLSGHTTLRPYVTSVDLTDSKILNTTIADVLIQYRKTEPRFGGYRLDVGEYRQEPFFIHWGQPRSFGKLEYKQLGIISAINPEYARQLASCSKFPDGTIDGKLNAVITSSEFARMIHDGRVSEQVAAVYEPGDREVIRARSLQLASSKENRGKYELPPEAFESISLDAFHHKEDGAFPRYRVHLSYDGKVAYAERIAHRPDFIPVVKPS